MAEATVARSNMDWRRRGNPCTRRTPTVRPSFGSFVSFSKLLSPNHINSNPIRSQAAVTLVTHVFKMSSSSTFMFFRVSLAIFMCLAIYADAVEEENFLFLREKFRADSDANGFGFVVQDGSRRFDNEAIIAQFPTRSLDQPGRQASSALQAKLGLKGMIAKYNGPIFACFLDKNFLEYPKFHFNTSSSTTQKNGKPEEELMACFPAGELPAIIHLLVIPKRFIYNAITLNQEDIELVTQMQKKGKEIVHAILQGGKARQRFIEMLREGVDMFHAEIPKGPDGKVGRRHPDSISMGPELDNITDEELNKKLDDARDDMNAGKDVISTAFHLPPHFSVGWLHLHAFVPQLITNVTHGFMKKNTPVDDIISWIQKESEKSH